MPKETISEHGIVRTSSVPNSIPKALLADEEFKKFRIQGTANEKKDAKQIKHTTTDQKNSLETTFGTSQLDFTNSPFAKTTCQYESFIAGPINSNRWICDALFGGDCHEFIQ